MQRTWPFEEGRETETDRSGEGLKEPPTERATESDQTPLIVERIESEVRAAASERESSSIPKSSEETPAKPAPGTPTPGTPGNSEVGQASPRETEVHVASQNDPATQAFRSPPLVQPQPAPIRQVLVRPTSRRVRVTIRYFDPWSVLKFSLVFYFSVMLVFLFAAMLLFFVADAAGIVGNLESFVQGVGWPDWEIRPAQLFRVLLLFGLVNAVFWSGANLVLTFLYNLVSDVVGGIQATTVERDQ